MSVEKRVDRKYSLAKQTTFLGGTTIMAAIDPLLRDFVKREDLPFVVAMAGNSKGVTYSGAAGDSAPGRAANESTVFRIFSMTKALGSTAAMMLIDRGRLNAEPPVEDILPEFANIRVLDRFDSDTPVMRAPKTKATIRNLA